MPTTYTPNAANNPATFSLPSDLDAQTAESVNAALRALGDKSAYAIATRAAIAAVNTFTRGQEIEPTAEDEPILLSRRYPGDITTDNRWALVFAFKYENNRQLRMFTGGLQGVGRMAWTMNAVWNVTDQLWEIEDDTAEAAAILWRDDAITIHHVPVGTSPFLHWPNTSIGDAGSVRAVGEFRYAQAKTRVRTIPASSASGTDLFFSGTTGAVSPATVGNHGYIRFPIRLPPGAVLQKVSVLHDIDTSAVETFEVTRRRSTWDPFDTTLPAESVLATQASDSSTGAHITDVTVSAAVDRYDELCLRWTPSAETGNAVHAIKVEFADQGPTPV